MLTAVKVIAWVTAFLFAEDEVSVKNLDSLSDDRMKKKLFINRNALRASLLS